MGNTINFSIDGDAAVIEKSPVKGDVKLPSYVSDADGISYPVRAIGNNAFSGNSEITSITIPSTVTTIGNYVFEGCSSLRFLTIPASVTSIGYGSLGDDNSAILQIYFEGTTPPKMGDADRLATIYVPTGCWTAYQSALHWYGIIKNLIEVDEAPEPFEIFPYTYEGVTLEYIVTSVNRVLTRPRLRVSYNLSGSVEIPSAFEHEGSVYFVEGTGEESFAGCSNITSITFPEMPLFEIGKKSFEGCSGITALSFPQAVRLEESAFKGCTGLTSAHEPSNTYGGSYENCSGIKSITFDDNTTTIPANEFYGCTSLTKLVIPDEVKSIYSRAFQRCTGLKTLTLGSSVTNIKTYAFANCSALTKITSLNPVPPTCDATAFDDVPTSATLYVPEGSTAAYKNDAVWSRFKKIVPISDVVIEGVPGDANGDGEVNVDDVVFTVQHILGDTPYTFNADNADVDGDGEINVSDVTQIVSIILGSE